MNAPIHRPRSRTLRDEDLVSTRVAPRPPTRAQRALSRAIARRLACDLPLTPETDACTTGGSPFDGSMS